MGYEVCPSPREDCPLPVPYADDHHLYWPGKHYTSRLEKTFRMAEVNVVRGLCRCLHNQEHDKRPPKKPSVAAMREVLNEQ